MPACPYDYFFTLEGRINMTPKMSPMVKPHNAIITRVCISTADLLFFRGYRAFRSLPGNLLREVPLEEE